MIKFVPVFSGTSENDEKIVLYKNVLNEAKLYIKVANNPLWILSQGTDVRLDFDFGSERLLLFVDGPEWRGTAKGSKAQLIAEQSIDDGHELAHVSVNLLKPVCLKHGGVVEDGGCPVCLLTETREPPPGGFV